MQVPRRLAIGCPQLLGAPDTGEFKMIRLNGAAVAIAIAAAWFGCGNSDSTTTTHTTNSSTASGASSNNGPSGSGGNADAASSTGVGGVGAGNAMPCQVSADLDDYITARMNEDNIPGLSAGIVTSEGLVWAKGYGLANIAQSTPVNQDTIFAVMSISKMVTAVGVMQQVETGALDLKTDINTYLNGVVVNPNISFQVSNPNVNGTITLEHLLSHTSGTAGDDYGVLQLNIKNSDAELQPLGEMLASLLHPQGARYDNGFNWDTTAPGAAFTYSSIGISLAAYVAEVVAKSGFDALTKKTIFDRLGMVNTSWRLSHYNDKKEQLAVMYNPVGGNLEDIEAFTFAEYPAGSIRSTVPELARFLTAMINRGTYGNQQILKPETVAAMEDSPFPNATNGGFYGLGMFLVDDDLRAHGGDDAGAATDMAYNRTTKKGVIILSNVTRQINNDAIYQRLLQEAELCP
jgi:CubicO group peptidase (beta-lactamase class C family)